MDFDIVGEKNRSTFACLLKVPQRIFSVIILFINEVKLAVVNTAVSQSPVSCDDILIKEHAYPNMLDDW